MRLRECSLDQLACNWFLLQLVRVTKILTKTECLHSNALVEEQSLQIIIKKTTDLYDTNSQIIVSKRRKKVTATLTDRSVPNNITCYSRVLVAQRAAKPDIPD